MTAPSPPRLFEIAAPIPRVPPVTSATRPSSERGPVPAACGAVSVAIACSSPLVLAIRARFEPVGYVRPDLLPRARAGHQADVAPRPVEVRHVLARDQVKQRAGARRRRDVVGAGGDHEQVLVDP